MKTKGAANQSLLKTCPSGQTKVRLKPTGGAAVKSLKVNISNFHYNELSYFPLGPNPR